MLGRRGEVSLGLYFDFDMAVLPVYISSLEVLELNFFCNFLKISDFVIHQWSETQDKHTELFLSHCSLFALMFPSKVELSSADYKNVNEHTVNV